MEESLLTLLTDPNHWLFELVAEVVFFIVELAIIGRVATWAAANYDRVKHHHKHNGGKT